MTETSPLRAALDKTASLRGCPLNELTVLTERIDPFRQDTKAKRRDGKWLADTAARLGLGSRKIHNRGLHYMILGEVKPNGRPYSNTDTDWKWLVDEPCKSARWLGYIPFGQITDERNAEPVMRRYAAPDEHEPRIWTDAGLTLPASIEGRDAEAVYRREATAAERAFAILGAPDEREWKPGFAGAQPYHLVLFGEKSSLEPVLGPVAARCQADLYLPTGEISDTLIHDMARSAIEDGRPMVIFYFADCDPAGWQMPVSVSRKLQAFAVMPGFEDMPGFEVRRVALTPAQVREFGLPVSMLKEGEKRAGKWEEATGTQQTEIDALAALRPELLTRLATEAVQPFWDATLDLRCREAYDDWKRRAQEVLDSAPDAAEFTRLRARAQQFLDKFRQLMDDYNKRVEVDDPDGFGLPDIEVPEAQADGTDGQYLLSSRDDFYDQCQALIASKRYDDA